MTTTEHRPAHSPLFSPCPPWCADAPHPWEKGVDPGTWGRIHESADGPFGNIVAWNEVKRFDGTPVEGDQTDDRVHIWIEADNSGENRLSTPDAVRAYLADITRLAEAAFPGFRASSNGATR